MGDTWHNWTGDQRCRPAEVVRPRSRDELAVAVAAAAGEGRTVSVAGAGHSFTETALTDGTMIDVASLNGVIDVEDSESGLIKVGAGTVLADLNERLHGLGLAMENLGDIDRQTIAGAISTGTHGTGAKLRNISAQVEAIELVTADGAVRTLDGSELDLLRAARVGIGALGAISAVTLRCVPAFTLLRTDTPQPREEVLDSFDERAEANDHFELFTFPYADSALVLERNRVEGPPRPRGRLAAYLNDIVLENWALEALSATGRLAPRAIPRLSRLAAALASGGKTVDRSDRVFASERRVRFTEMEYGVPREHGPAAARRVIEWVRANRYPVFFPIEMRVAAGDDALLSPSHGRDTAYIAVHQYRGMEWRPYFEAVEEIMRDYGGRPHWGKRHFQSAETLAPLYPEWARFQAARDELDPDRVFANEYAMRILGP
ncbi:MAG TPA: D-arabinono-1,4-lactone oxidase [Solirubrobacterales bacterium]|nr:D-arabinono-1,4-lactone oxidase [Solirubrobacterales bacterium]